MHPSAGEPPLTLYDPSGPYADPARGDRHRKGPGAPARGLGPGPRRRRGGRAARGQAGGQRQRPGRHLAPVFRTDRNVLRAKAGARRDPAGIRPRRDRHAGDGIRRHPREPAPRGGRSVHPRRRGLRRRDPRLRHAGVRARRGRPRPRHHPGQHQPRRAGADGHRPQLPGQDQRQHRQLGGALVGRRRGRQDGLGDPLGRRHDHGPLHRPQHPQHPRVDHPQLPDARSAPCRSTRRWRRSTASPRT